MYRVLFWSWLLLWWGAGYSDARLLVYCARLLGLYTACPTESLGIDVRAKRALLGVWILGAADAAGL